MSKDYANKNKFTKQRKRRPDRKFLPFAGAMMVIVCFISLMVYAIHLYHQSIFFSKEHMAGWFNSAKTLVSRKEKIIKTVHEAAVPHDEIQFDFYTELPSMKVNFPETTQLKAVDKTDSIKTVMPETNLNKAPSTQFILLLGEFNDQLNASQLRLSLLLAGIATEIVKVSEHQYQVQLGPYTSERQAQSAEKRLNKKGFEGSVKKL